MYLKDIENLECYSKLSLKQVEDRLLITANFPKEFLLESQMTHPFLYVILYVRGKEMIKILDEGTAKLYIPSKKEIDPKTYKKIIDFAKKHSKQFKND
ncbi:hypothetical protein [Halobacillus halophilus]|uniref:hypothetical protein n=1 Tax=Halobacillus halophilus TaxID=1570 RepID=UPI001CD4B28F|nr:hypothetical protein [Halobacillus halophilus]MCA1013031.1 hypothetical protein [Halobacillus halophilus]